MRFTTLFLTVVLLQFSFSAQCQTLNFSGKDVRLQVIFSTIKKQTGVLFFYDAALLKKAKPVTVDWKDATLETALNDVFKEQPFSWALENKTVTIVKNTGPAPPVESTLPPPPPLRIKGIITDEEGKPINGVTVAIKGTKKGTVSDSAGRFSITTERKKVLAFSTINYYSQEVQVVSEAMNIVLQQDIKSMETLMVGGNLNAIKRKADATSVTVLDRKTLEKIPVNTIDQVFRGWVPGVNSIDIGDAPETFPALTIRGAQGPTSLDIIAVYVDGIEYAGGSGFLSQLDKTNIDRIEVVRGPGAATMYGTGSNGGIIQIFTKREKANESSVNFTSSAGFYKSKWMEADAFQQMQNLETTTGFKHAVLKLGGSYRTINAYLPEGGEKNKGFYGSVNYDQGKWQANLTARFNVRNFHYSRKPYYDTATHPRTDIIIEPSPGVYSIAYEYFNVRPTSSVNKDGLIETFISGINLSHRTSKNWINNLVAGYTYNNNLQVPVQDGVASLQRQYVSDLYNITTIRYSNVLNLYSGSSGLAAVLTSGAEYKKYSSSRILTRATAATTGIIEDPANNNYGGFVQANPSYKNVYLTLGLRYERNDFFKSAWNPRLGITTNFETKTLIIKPRISLGRGITAPTYEERFGRPQGTFSGSDGNPDLKPQSQQGADYGLEVFHKKNIFQFEVVHYDNIIKDMIYPGGINFMAINVAKVANSGWEFSGSYRPGRFSLQGTFSIMNSTMKDSSGTHALAQLQLAPGERLVNLPKHTAGFNVTYNFLKLFGTYDKGSVSINATEVDGIKIVDFRTYALDVAYGRTPYVQGVISYPVVTQAVIRVGLYADYNIAANIRFFVQGSNILNDYKYEYWSEYPTHGATWLFGLKCNFTTSK
jgi:outer membrane receptor protein involved in Fe transport